MNHLKNPQKVAGKLRKNFFEKAVWEAKMLACGIDEVGRGCLAGPLVTSAVILPMGKTSRLLKDSKLLTLQERLKAAKWIKKHCWYGYGIVHHRIIDKHNIWHATLIAMKKALMHAVSSCPQQLGCIVVDAMPLRLYDTSYKNIPVHYFIEGERKSSSIAAASILAKVKRDEMMKKMAGAFPGYSLERHKGYSTKKHKEAIKQISYSIIHRQSFIKWLLTKPEELQEEQSDIFDTSQNCTNQKAADQKIITPDINMIETV